MGFLYMLTLAYEAAFGCWLIWRYWPEPTLEQLDRRFAREHRIQL